MPALYRTGHVPLPPHHACPLHDVYIHSNFLHLPPLNLLVNMAYIHTSLTVGATTHYVHSTVPHFMYCTTWYSWSLMSSTVLRVPHPRHHGQTYTLNSPGCVVYLSCPV